MIVYNCNKYELPLFNTRLLLDYCGSYFWEKYACRVVKGGERDGYRSLVLLKCFPKGICFVAAPAPGRIRGAVGQCSVTPQVAPAVGQCCVVSGVQGLDGCPPRVIRCLCSQQEALQGEQ